MIKITFLGDIMCKQEMLKAFRNENNYDFHEIFEKIKKDFSNSDLVIGNLETPISKNTKKLTKEEYCFSSPYEFAKSVYDAGIKCVSTANNHCLDRGVEGIKETIECLDEIGIIHTGTFCNKNTEPLEINLNGIKIGLLSYTYGTNAFSNKNYLKSKEKYYVNLFQNQELSNKITRYCYYHNNIFCKIYRKINKFIFRCNSNCQVYERKEFDFNCKRKLKKDIKYLKQKNVDLIIMLSHMGGQYNNKETENTKKLCRYLIKNGVDIIVGNHEHTVHGGVFDKINENKIISYSLGNFDGIAGVYDKPYDKMAEYSIMWNIYINKENNNIKLKTTFSVLKTIETENKKIQTVPVYDLIQTENNIELKNKLINDIKEVAYRFSGHKYNTIEKEYYI